MYDLGFFEAKSNPKLSEIAKEIDTCNMKEKHHNSYFIENSFQTL